MQTGGACTPHEHQAWTRWSQRNQRQYLSQSSLGIVAKGWVKKKG